MRLIARHMSSNDFNAAINLFHNLVSTRESSSSSSSSEVDPFYQADFWCLRAYAYERIGDFDEAERMWEAAIQYQAQPIDDVVYNVNKYCERRKIAAINSSSSSSASLLFSPTRNARSSSSLGMTPIVKLLKDYDTIAKSVVPTPTKYNTNSSSSSGVAATPNRTGVGMQLNFDEEEKEGDVKKQISFPVGLLSAQKRSLMLSTIIDTPPTPPKSQEEQVAVQSTDQVTSVSPSTSNDVAAPAVILSSPPLALFDESKELTPASIYASNEKQAALNESFCGMPSTPHVTRTLFDDTRDSSSAESMDQEQQSTATVNQLFVSSEKLSNTERSQQQQNESPLATELSFHSPTSTPPGGALMSSTASVDGNLLHFNDNHSVEAASLFEDEHIPGLSTPAVEEALSAMKSSGRPSTSVSALRFTPFTDRFPSSNSITDDSSFATTANVSIPTPSKQPLGFGLSPYHHGRASRVQPTVEEHKIEVNEEKIERDNFDELLERKYEETKEDVLAEPIEESDIQFEMETNPDMSTSSSDISVDAADLTDEVRRHMSGSTVSSAPSTSSQSSSSSTSSTLSLPESASRIILAPVRATPSQASSHGSSLLLSPVRRSVRNHSSSTSERKTFESAQVNSMTQEKLIEMLGKTNYAWKPNTAINNNGSGSGSGNGNENAMIRAPLSRNTSEESVEAEEEKTGEQADMAQVAAEVATTRVMKQVEEVEEEEEVVVKVQHLSQRKKKSTVAALPSESSSSGTVLVLQPVRCNRSSLRSLGTPCTPLSDDYLISPVRRSARHSQPQSQLAIATLIATSPYPVVGSSGTFTTTPAPKSRRRKSVAIMKAVLETQPLAEEEEQEEEEEEEEEEEKIELQILVSDEKSSSSSRKASGRKGRNVSSNKKSAGGKRKRIVAGKEEDDAVMEALAAQEAAIAEDDEDEMQANCNALAQQFQQLLDGTATAAPSTSSLMPPPPARVTSRSSPRSKSSSSSSSSLCVPSSTARVGTPFVAAAKKTQARIQVVTEMATVTEEAPAKRETRSAKKSKATVPAVPLFNAPAPLASSAPSTSPFEFAMPAPRVPRSTAVTAAVSAAVKASDAIVEQGRRVCTPRPNEDAKGNAKRARRAASPTGKEIEDEEKQTRSNHALTTPHRSTRSSSSSFLSPLVDIEAVEAHDKTPARRMSSRNKREGTPFANVRPL